MNRIRFYCNHSTETRSYTLSYENAHPEYKYFLANDSFGSRYRTLSEAVNGLCHRYYSVQNSIKSFEPQAGRFRYEIILNRIYAGIEHFSVEMDSTIQDTSVINFKDVMVH